MSNDKQSAEELEAKFNELVEQNPLAGEALAELPPLCMNRLEDDVLKMPLPPQWEYARLLARYARALFLRHDEAEAAALLPALEAEIEKQGRRRAILVRMQEKAGLLPTPSDP